MFVAVMAPKPAKSGKAAETLNRARTAFLGDTLEEAVENTFNYMKQCNYRHSYDVLAGNLTFEAVPTKPTIEFELKQVKS